MQNFRRNLIYLGFTASFCLAIGLLLWHLGVTESAWTSILISLCIGWSINLTFILAENLIGQYMPRLSGTHTLNRVWIDYWTVDFREYSIP